MFEIRPWCSGQSGLLFQIHKTRIFIGDSNDLRWCSRSSFKAQSLRGKAELREDDSKRSSQPATDITREYDVCQLQTECQGIMRNSLYICCREAYFSSQL